MINIPCHRALAMVLLLASLTPAVHAEDGALLADSQWLVHGGGDVGKDHSRGVSASIDYTGRSNSNASDSRYWDAGGAFSRSQSTVKATVLRPETETRTGTGNAYASYGSERWRGVLGFDATKDEGLRKSQRVSGGVDFAHGAFGANLTASRRRTTFDDFTISAAAAALLGIPLGTDAIVGCSITDKGIGARVGYNGASFGAYASGNTYHYDKAACATNFVLPDRLQRLSDADFFDLAGRFLDRARSRRGGRIGQNSRLLKSEFGAGFSFAWHLQWAVDYLRYEDQFGGATGSNYSLTGTLGLASNVSLDLTLGNTSGDGGSAPYLGVMLAVGL
jgi:hypothetical protein